jgi:RNA polymerase sigma-70 factor (ECF subfamily)
MLSMIEDERERLKIADIYEKYRYKCFHVAFKIVKNNELAEDAVEDAFIEVIKQKDKIFALNCSDLLSYVVTIVKSRAINILKKYKRIGDTPLEEFAEIIESDDISVDEQVINKQGFEFLVGQIKNLDENYKIVFEMKYLHLMSNDEIAKALGLTKKNIEQRLYRAKLKLRGMLKSEVK